MVPMPDGVITVVLADDNLIVREGVRALLSYDRDVEVVGAAGDFDELIAQAMAMTPQVVAGSMYCESTTTPIEGCRRPSSVAARIP